ncbi:hypothetical protein RQP46_011109 [Phenoliferia psychrophenolica]
MSDEQQFTIQPHPAKDNVAPSETTGGLGSAPNLSHLPKGPADTATSKGPHVPSAEIASQLEKPKTREELQAMKDSFTD